MPFYTDFGEAIFNHPRLANSDVFASQTSRAHIRYTRKNHGIRAAGLCVSRSRLYPGLLLDGT